MALSKFVSVWHLLSKHTFVIDSIKEDLACVICKKLVVDAVQSHVCGCQYCYKCVNEYTHDGDKHCPGGKEDCKDDHVVLDRNAFRSMLLNKKVSKLKANCPNQSCLFNTELIVMEDHLRLCTKQPKECPYAVIGCNLEMSNKDSTVSHLHCDTLPHTELLIGLITSMKNEIHTLRDDFDKSNSEVLFLKEERNREINEQRRQSEDVRIERENVTTIVNDMRKEMREERKKEPNRKRRINNLVKLCPNIDADFVCRIDQCSQKRDKYINSEPFFANNYKLCLSVYIKSDTDNIYLVCWIMKGDNDDKVQWPMRRSVTLGIVDQRTLRTHKSETYQSAFYRPTNESLTNKCGRVGGSMIKYSSIKDKASIIVDDSIVVSCVITDP